MSLRSPSSNLSAGICELSVTCSVLGDWSLAFCNKDGCRTSDGIYSKVNITISTHNRSVVCSGENHVSKDSASEDMEKTCKYILFGSVICSIPALRLAEFKFENIYTLFLYILKLISSHSFNSSIHDFVHDL